MHIISERFVEVVARGAVHIHKLLQLVEGHSLLVELFLFQLVSLRAHQRLNEPLLVLSFVTVKHISDHQAQLANRGRAVLCAGVCQETHLQVVQLQGIDLVEYQLHGESLVPFHRLFVDVLALHQVLVQTLVQEGRLAFNGQTLVVSVARLDGVLDLRLEELRAGRRYLSVFSGPGLRQLGQIDRSQFPLSLVNLACLQRSFVWLKPLRVMIWILSLRSKVVTCLLGTFLLLV